MPENTKSKIFYGYIIIAVSLFILVIMHGVLNTYSVLFSSLQKELGENRATIASANSLSFLLGGISGIFLGRMTDRFGPKVVIIGCGLLMGAGFLLMSRVSNMWQLYLSYSVMIGIGSSSGNVSLLSTATRWFTKRRGLMTGMVKVGTGLGIFIMPVVASWLISRYDWRTALNILAVIAVVGIVPISFFLKRDPQQMGLKPYGEDGTEETNSKSSGGVQLSLAATMHTRQFWLLSGAYFLAGYVTQSVMLHTVPFAQDGGLPIVQAASIISIIGVVSIAGRLILGAAGDRVGNKKALLVCFFVLLAALFWLQFTRGLWMLYAFALVYGFAHGGFYAVMSPMVAELFGTKSHGVNFGMVMLLQGIGAAIGPVITGFLFDHFDNYRLAFLILIAVSASALALTLAIKPVRLSTQKT